jgi:hypothetical protein
MMGKGIMASSVRNMLSYALLLLGYCSYAQTVSPVILEYKGKAEGSIALTNNTSIPLVVVLEPRSFSITPDGSGVYRPLDPKIHVRLSSMSSRINPGQTYYVFYKAKADTLPAWFTIYSTFSPVRNKSRLDIRILLPHTVYIYPRKPQSKDDLVEVTQATYFREADKIVCELANNTVDLERVEEVRVASKAGSITSPGFPLLPGTKRHLEVDWRQKDPPREIVLLMDRSTITLPLRGSN